MKHSYFGIQQLNEAYGTNRFVSEGYTLNGKSDNTSGYPSTNAIFNGVNICIASEDEKVIEQSLEHLDKDLIVVKKEYDKAVNNLVSWLKSDSSVPDFTVDEFKSGSKLYEADYIYSHYIAKYSPSGKDGDFGSFTFSFEPNSSKMRDVFQAVALEVVISGNKITTRCYDI